MGFSGKPSRSCAPCRALRTRCDLAQPSCTQCIRKNRVCSGYRDLTDVRIVNQTSLVVRKAVRTRQRENDPTQRKFSVDNFIVDTLNIQHPSRLAALQDEATLYFFANYSDQLFPGDGYANENGMFQLYQKESVNNGSIAEIIRAIGMAALGNKGNHQLLVAARAKQLKVLGQLNEQLQYPQTGVTRSTLLTCMLLASFEAIICDSPQSMQVGQSHIQGAITMVELLGPPKLFDALDTGIYLRLRDNILAKYLSMREAIPKQLITTVKVKGPIRHEKLWRLSAQTTHVLHDHKIRGSVNSVIEKECQHILEGLKAWEEEENNFIMDSNIEERILTPQESVWSFSVWVLCQTCRVLLSDVMISSMQTPTLEESSLPASIALDNALADHLEMCTKFKERTEAQLRIYSEMRSSVGTGLVYDLLWPLYILANSLNCPEEIKTWIFETAELIADVFRIRQAKIFANDLRDSLREGHNKYVARYPLSYRV